VGGTAIVVGVAGLVFHLESQFFEQRTIASLVYTAPFAAPLAYAGVGLLIVLNRMVDERGSEWGRWVSLLALAGFLGNFVLCLADHAQNGFIAPTEWIGVIAAAVAVGFLALVIARPQDGPLRWTAGVVMAGQFVVAVVGFGLHVAGNVGRPGTTLVERFLYGAPAFAPLLFADLALVAMIGLWSLERARGDEARRAVVAAPVGV
jgi:hypothetical protein